MPKYQYKAVDENKNKVEGSLFAQSETDLYKRLRDTKIYAYEITESEKSVKTYAKLKTKDLSDFARQVGTMQASGISIMKAIDIMRERDIKPKVKEVYDAIYRVVNQGNSLSEAMISCTGAFPTLMIHMFQAGEMSGRLETIADKMAHHYESDNKINSKIKGALAYPMVLCIVMVLVVAILFVFVLPVFFGMYEDSGSDLPWLTQVLKDITVFVQSKWYVVLVVGCVTAFFIRLLLKIRAVVKWIDGLKLTIPKIGPLLSVIYTARFARTMSSVYSSGIPMIQAVDISSKTIGNLYLEDQFYEVIRKVETGNALSDSLGDLVGIEKKLNSSIYIGEESGRLDEMLLSLADEYEFESNAAIDRLLTFIEPILILLMAVVIGSVMIAVMLPMFNMFTVIG